MNKLDIESAGSLTQSTTQPQWKEQQDQTYPTHRAGDRNSYRNYHQFDSHKMISQEEGSLREEVEEPQEEEDSPEAEDTLEEEEYHQEDHQEVHGDHHHFQFRRHKLANW